MALTPLQRAVMQCLARNRSETSYVAGGAVLNRDWQRLSDDLDVFHDTDEQVVKDAEKDIESLRAAGFRVVIDVKIFGVMEARVSGPDTSETVIQWMSETRQRFFPIVHDEEWGARLHQVDLAVNKILAASTRTKARDYVDLVSISQRMCPLGPLVMGAAGKPPNYSPQKIIDEIRRRGLSVPSEDFLALRGVSADPAKIRADLDRALTAAETYIAVAPVEAVGAIAVDSDGTPIELRAPLDSSIELRTSTRGEAMPSPVDASVNW